MKRRFSCLLVAIMLAAPVASIFTTGCGSTGSSSALKIATETEAATVTTVDGAMKGWADYANAGKATPAQVTSVHAAYDKYYSAQLIVKAALEKWAVTPADTGADYQTAKASEDAAKNALLDLITSLTKKAP